MFISKNFSNVILCQHVIYYLSKKFPSKSILTMSLIPIITCFIGFVLVFGPSLCSKYTNIIIQYIENATEYNDDANIALIWQKPHLIKANFVYA